MELKIEDAVLRDCFEFKDNRNVKLKLLQLSLIDSPVIIDDKCKLANDISIVTALNAYCDLLSKEFEKESPEAIVYHIDFPKKDESVLDKKVLKSTIYFMDSTKEENAKYLVSYDIKLKMLQSSLNR